MRLQVFIFSYNRGEFLRNCVESVRQFASDSQIAVVDDNSHDPRTCAYLAALPDGVQLLQPEAGSQGRHGGLYNNMQLALGHANSNDRLLFIQDDMQLVRPLSADDFQYIEEFFSYYPRAAFLHPAFLKGERQKRDRRITSLASGFPVYFRDSPGRKKQHGLTYSDVVLAHAGRLRQAGWQFRESEVANADQASALFGKMGFMAHPFVMFLPQVPLYRGRCKSAVVRLAERWSGTSLKNFLAMTPEEIGALKQRPLSDLPVAENFLQCSDNNVKRPYRYSAINAFPLLRVLHKLNQSFARYRRFGKFFPEPRALKSSNIHENDIR